MVWHFSLQRKLHRGWALDQQLAGSHNKRRIRVPDTRGELSKGAGIARVRVGPKQNLMERSDAPRHVLQIGPKLVSNRTFRGTIPMRLYTRDTRGCGEGA